MGALPLTAELLATGKFWEREVTVSSVHLLVSLPYSDVYSQVLVTRVTLVKPRKSQMKAKKSHECGKGA